VASRLYNFDRPSLRRVTEPHSLVGGGRCRVDGVDSGVDSRLCGRSVSTVCSGSFANVCAARTRCCRAWWQIRVPLIGHQSMLSTMNPCRAMAENNHMTITGELPLGCSLPSSFRIASCGVNYEAMGNS
jgi:hypothetical protein